MVKIDILDDGIRTPEVFRGYRVHIGSPEGVPGIPPATTWALMGQAGDRQAPKGWRAPLIWAGQIGVENGKEESNKGIGFTLPPLPFLLRRGIGKEGGRIGRRPSRIPPTWGAALAAYPPLKPIYMRGAPLEHTSRVVSRVQRPLDSLRLRSYCRCA